MATQWRVKKVRFQPIYKVEYNLPSGLLVVAVVLEAVGSIEWDKNKFEFIIYENLEKSQQNKFLAR